MLKVTANVSACGVAMSLNTTIKTDCTLTLIATICFLWFGYQYGYENSPDSWYRCALAKTILNGHPFFINIKQGWFYEYGAWHHDSTHEPLLPLVYAFFFLVTGAKAWVASLITTLSAGLLLYPLLRLSRYLAASAWPGLAIYIWGTLNAANEFLREVIGGLSIPTSLLVLFSALCALEWLLRSEKRRAWIFFGVALAALYLNRADAQPVLLLTAFLSIPLSYFYFNGSTFSRYCKGWGIAALLVSPWVARKILLFKNPIFRDAYPMIWSDRAYDYYSYHENGEYPSAARYFLNHSFSDFLHKNLIEGPKSLYTLLSEFFYGPPSLYLLAFCVGLFLVLRKRGHIGFVGLLSYIITTGYLCIFSISTFNEPRHLLPVYFLLVGNSFIILARAIHFVSSSSSKLRHTLSIFAFSALMLIHFPFLRTLPEKYFRYRYTSADEMAKKDSVYSILATRIKKDAVVLAPFSQAQAFGFFTSLPMLETPDNLGSLKDPLAFLRKYNVKYSLLNIQHLVPAENISAVSYAGSYLLLALNTEPRVATQESVLQEKPLTFNIQLPSTRPKIYWDTFHSWIHPSSNLESIAEIHLGSSTLDSPQERTILSQSDIFVVGYGDTQSFSKSELEQLYAFFDRGGSLLTGCPGWYWVASNPRNLEELPCNQASLPFESYISREQIEGPYAYGVGLFGGDAEPIPSGALFSSVVSLKGQPIIRNSTGIITAVATRRRDSKAVIIGQDFLLGREYLNSERGRITFQKIIGWLTTK